MALFIKDITSRLENILSIVGISLFFILWQLLSDLLGPVRLPSPVTVFYTVFENLLQGSPEAVARTYFAGKGEVSLEVGLFPHMLQTTIKCLSGSATGMALGIGFGLLMGWSRSVRLVFEPVIELIRAAPPLALVPFFLMWFGRGFQSAFIMMMFYGFIFLVVNTVEAIRNVPRIYEQAGQTLGATKGQIYRTIIVHAIVPQLIGGIRVALAVAWGIIIVAEMLGIPVGLGRIFLLTYPFMFTKMVIAVIVCTAFLALVSDQVFLRIALYKTTWVPREKITK